MSLMSEFAPGVQSGQTSTLPRIKAEPLTEPLEPFLHQVGGHSALSQTEGRIWKPMIQKELRFYQTIWSEDFATTTRWLRDWTPQFYGLYEREESSEATNVHDLCLERRLSSRAKTAKETARSTAHAGDKNNPWFSRLQELHLQQKPKILFLALEDLTAKFKRPCILDCKMGTRSYDNEATPAKRQRHINKCNLTTSGTVGIRFSGMQVYRADLGRYAFWDKYHGRKLQVTDLLPNLEIFFNNGYGLRYDSIRRCLESLKRLQAYIEGQTTYMFFSSSLLLVYDGSDNSQQPRVDVRMIDFAHTEQSVGENDSGYSLGISTLVDLLNTLICRRH